MRLIHAVIGLSILSGCAHEAEGGTRQTPPPREADTTCTAPGLERAHRLDIVAMPPGCTFTNGGSTRAPRVLRTADELTASIACQGAPPPSIDMATHDVYVVTYTMSPAGTGLVTFDDGATLTFVSRFRQPCPDDPMPMPMNATFAFTMPKDATRVYAEANCTMPLDCD